MLSFLAGKTQESVSTGLARRQRLRSVPGRRKFYEAEPKLFDRFNGGNELIPVN
jgi:hypothetical protein